jgi:hypothetical protein
MTAPRPTAWVLALAAALLASASARAAEPVQNPDRTCPRIVILGNADHATNFEGKGRDVTDIVYTAKLASVDGSCRHRGSNQVNIEVTATVTAEQGLAAKGTELEIPIFAAVIDPEELVVTKETATATLKFERGQRSGSTTAEFRTIKLVLAEDTIGEDLEVVVGLQLDKDQLDYVRAGH